MSIELYKTTESKCKKEVKEAQEDLNVNNIQKNIESNGIMNSTKENLFKLKGETSLCQLINLNKINEHKTPVQSESKEGKILHPNKQYNIIEKNGHLNKPRPKSEQRIKKELAELTKIVKVPDKLRKSFPKLGFETNLIKNMDKPKVKILKEENNINIKNTIENTNEINIEKLNFKNSTKLLNEDGKNDISDNEFEKINENIIKENIMQKLNPELIIKQLNILLNNQAVIKKIVKKISKSWIKKMNLNFLL